MIALIDADILLYRFAFKHQEELFDEYIPGDIEDAIADIELFLMDIKHATKAEDYLLCFSSAKNFRKTLVPSYKEFRKKSKKPALLASLRARLLTAFPSLVWENIEADDVMGILATREPDKYVICSIDKDLNQIPGKHFNWKDLTALYTPPVYEVDEETAWQYFYKQVLAGDPADGYSGVPGIGPKKAERILAGLSVNEMWDAVVKTYTEHGLTEEDALNTARLAFILRDGYYDEENGEVTLWEPYSIKKGGETCER